MDIVPLPSWPELLSPQQYATPAGVRPHVWLPPALTSTNSIPVVVESVAAPLPSPLIAVIVTWPSPRAITSPVELTVAIAILLLDHVTGPVAFVVVAVNCICCPAITLAVAGETVTVMAGALDPPPPPQAATRDTQRQ